MGPGLCGDATKVLAGLLLGWSSLPLDIQKATKICEVTYTGSDGYALETDKFRFKFKTDLPLGGGTFVLFPSFEIGLVGLGPNIETTVSQKLKDSVLAAVKKIAEGAGANDPKLQRMLA